MLGPGDHTSFRNKTSTAINAAIKYGKNFKDFTPDSWTTYLSSALKDPRPVLQRISKSKAAVAVCPAPMVEDVGAAPIREPVLRGPSSVPAPQFSVPMDLVSILEPPFVPETVAQRFAADIDAVHVQKFGLGSVVRVHPDTTPGVRPVQALGISRANIVAFDAGTGDYSVMPIDGSFRRARAVREHQLEVACREGLDTLYFAPSTHSRSSLARATTAALEARNEAVSGQHNAEAELALLRAPACPPAWSACLLPACCVPTSPPASIDPLEQPVSIHWSREIGI